MTTLPDPEDEPLSHPEPSLDEGGAGDAPPAEGPMETYPDAPDSLIALWMRRKRRLKLDARDSFPPEDLDMKALLAAPIPHDLPPLEGSQTLHAKKLHAMRVELAGKPELSAVNAILIAHLRKQRYPSHAPALFRRIWTEAGQTLMHELPGRWLISSAITFGDHGETEAQRRIGLAINVLFSLMKLYEFERFHSGSDPAQPFPIRRIRGRRLPLDMPHFNLGSGGLDINLLAQIWNEARKEPVAGALACHLLQRLNEDPGNLFRRIGMMRAGKRLDDFSRMLDAELPGQLDAEADDPPSDENGTD